MVAVKAHTVRGRQRGGEVGLTDGSDTSPGVLRSYAMSFSAVWQG